MGREKEALRTAPGVLVFKSGRMVKAFMKMRKGLTDYGKDEEWKKLKKSEWPHPGSVVGSRDGALWKSRPPFGHLYNEGVRQRNPQRAPGGILVLKFCWSQGELTCGSAATPGGPGRLFLLPARGPLQAGSPRSFQT